MYDANHVFHPYRNGYEYRNCTDYVQWKEGTVGILVPSNWGNGGDWYNSAPATERTTTPQAWDAAVKPSTWSNGVETDPGHVAFVESVNWVDANNPLNDNITVSEYNHDAQGYGDTRSGTASAMGFTEFVDFGKHPADSGSGGSSTTWSGNFATTWAPGRLDAFVKTSATSGNNVGHEWYGGTWNWDSLPALNQHVASWPSAVSWGSGRIDLFAQSNSKSLIHAWYDGSWHNWEDFGGCITGAPAVSSWGSLRLDVFTKGCNDNVHLFHNWYDGAWHQDLVTLNGSIASSPTAVTWGVGRIDVFATDSNGTLVQTYYDGTGWYGWIPIGPSGSCISGAPSVSTWGVGRLDVFARDCPDGMNLVHMWYDGAWHGYEDITPTQQITTSPSAVSWGFGRIDVFARSSSGHVLHRYYDSTGWHVWEDLGGSLGS